jgi:hypothetical protein
MRAGFLVRGKASFAVVLAAIFGPVFGLGASAANTTEHNATYVSTDMASVIVFKGKEVKFGPFFALSPVAWAPSIASYVSPADDVQCVSMGPRDNSEEFAIKRPIRVADHYKCRRTKFVVLRCFMNCRSAVVRMERPLGEGAPGTLTSYLYVDDCLGVTAFSQIKDFTAGIPIDAPWLRSSVGVLANNSYPRCRLF